MFQVELHPDGSSEGESDSGFMLAILRDKESVTFTTTTMIGRDVVKLILAMLACTLYAS